MPEKLATPRNWAKYSWGLGLVKKLGLDRRQASFVLAPARTRLAPPAQAAASQKWKIIYLQVLSICISFLCNEEMQNVVNDRRSLTVLV